MERQVHVNMEQESTGMARREGRAVVTTKCSNSSYRVKR